MITIQFKGHQIFNIMIHVPETTRTVPYPTTEQSVLNAIKELMTRDHIMETTMDSLIQITIIKKALYTNHTIESNRPVDLMNLIRIQYPQVIRRFHKIITIVISRFLCSSNNSSSSIVSHGLKRAGPRKFGIMTAQIITIIQMWTRIQNVLIRLQIEELQIGKNGVDFVILQI